MNKDLIITAISEYGVKEEKGEASNRRILYYFKYIGFEWIKEDETAWCSTFINYCAKKCGLENSGKLNARSWLDIGEKTETPENGDIVIFWRETPQSWKGHVGIFFGYNEKGTHINTFGGNQDNMVKFKYYPINQVLGFRKLRKL